MNDQTSPTAGGQGPGSSPWRNPFQEPQSGQGLPGVPRFGDGNGKDGGSQRPGFRDLMRQWRPDLLAAGILFLTGALLGLPAGLLWYRFAPTVWLTIPADAVAQVKGNVDQSALLVAPEAKGIASVDGYYFVITALVGLLLGTLGFWLARRGVLGGDDREGGRDGAGVGAWAGVLLGGLAASTVAAALGRLVSMPDPLAVLHTIAAGHAFHAPVALHAQGLYFAAPLLGMVLFLALTAAFTKPAPPPWHAVQDRVPTYFSADNPYGFPAGGNGGKPQGSKEQPGSPPDGTHPGNTPQQADPSRS